MNNFSEWLKEEEFKLWEEIYNESLWDMLKGAGGAARGLLRAGHGFMTVGDEALAKMVGDGTKGRMTQGWKDLGGGLRDAVVGKPKKEPTQTPATAPESSFKTASNPEIKIKSTTQTSSPATAQEKTSSPAGPAKTSWDDLVKKYNSTTSKEERRRIQVQLAQLDPIRYQQALENAYKLKLRKHAMRSGAARAT